jgi:hypothetical protein
MEGVLNTKQLAKDNLWFDRVTDVLAMFTKMHEIDPDVLQNAANRGTAVHHALDGYIYGDLPMYVEEPEWEGYLKSAEAWVDARTFIANPGRFWDNTRMLTGSPDAFYVNDEDEIVLVDFKTSAVESKTWKLQGSAYAFMARKHFDMDVKRIEFIRLQKNGNPCKVHSYVEDFDMFEKCLDVFRYFTAKKRTPGENGVNTRG